MNACSQELPIIRTMYSIRSSHLSSLHPMICEDERTITPKTFTPPTKTKHSFLVFSILNKLMMFRWSVASITFFLSLLHHPDPTSNILLPLLFQTTFTLNTLHYPRSHLRVPSSPSLNLSRFGLIF